MNNSQQSTSVNSHKNGTFIIPALAVIFVVIFFVLFQASRDPRNLSVPSLTPTATSTATITPTLIPTATSTPTITPSLTPTATSTPTLIPSATATEVCVFASFQEPGLLPNPDSNLANITFPSNCKTDLPTDPIPVSVRGTYQKAELKDQPLWLLVYPTYGTYYPQFIQSANECFPAVSQIDDVNWSGKVFLGKSDIDSVPQFDIILATSTDDKSEKMLMDWLKKACDNIHNKQPVEGIPGNKLPSGLVELAYITVQTPPNVLEPVPTPTIGG